MSDDRYEAMRHEMVTVIAAYVQHTGDRLGKVTLDGRVMEAMGKVPRHAFVTHDLAPFAYFDSPLPIGFDKTISQPFMVALMTDLLDVQQGDKVLEVGTGLGYHAAILAELAAAVFSVEIIEELAERAGDTLRHLGYGNVEMRVGDGSKGWHEHAPFDKILVAAAPDLVPPSLILQLKPGGKMVVPAGLPGDQQLMLVEKDADGRPTMQEILPVSFGPLETYD
jgi:protein-L-isoaspartate(D-aspartate) O-methyltransferase